MRRELTLTEAAIDEAALVRARAASAGMGAAVAFAGLVRGREAGAAIRGLEYEAFRAMAERQFGLLLDGLAARWPAVESVRLVHRLGPVAVGEASLWVEVVAPHRAEAFAAGQWLIDEMKRVVPIWKRALA
jgi:molybdopterin synthase catalytic subunit